MYEIWIVCDQERVEFWRSLRLHGVKLVDCGPDIAMPSDAVFVRGLQAGGTLYSNCKADPVNREKVKARITVLREKLQNPQFVSRAPATVVQSVRDKLAELEDLLGDNHEHNLHAR